MHSTIRRFILVLLALYNFSSVRAENLRLSDTVTTYKIWDKAGHQAFTDLIRFKNAFYCSFREGESHVATGISGKIRILKSKDGKVWTSAALLQINSLDLRDPKLSITPDGRLMITLAGAVFNNGVPTVLIPMSSFSDKNGTDFSIPVKAVLDPAINPSKDWIWRVTWHKGIGYGVNYQLRENAKDRATLKNDAWELYVMKTTDGINFQNVKKLDVKDLPNESTIRFDKAGQMYVLIRREAKDKMGVLATSNSPFSEWKHQTLKYRLGGPNFIFLDNDRLLVGTRDYTSDPVTVLHTTDLNGNIIKSLKLPSSGDNSYTGLVVFKKKLWVSYYSSHEGKTSIYLATIPMKMVN